MRYYITIFCSLLIFACQAPEQSDSGDDASLGKIAFEVKGSPEAMPHFERGVAALHNFWYPEALEAFQKARELDPDFAMAHWGEAMSYNRTFWQIQDKEAAQQTLQSLGADAEERLAKAGSEKEKMFLQSLDILYSEVDDKLQRDRAYMQFMKDFYSQYPGDHEVAAFYSLSLLGVLRNNQGNEKERMEAAAVVQKVLTENSEHPGAVHYLIHSLDDPLHAPMALEAARTYARIAPESNHALHMPSHIFVQLGLWDEVIKSNINAFAASQKWVERKELSIADWDYHSLAWMSYGYEQRGQFEKSAENLQKIKDAQANGGGSDYYLPIMQANHVVNSQSWQLLPAPEWEDKKGRALYAEVSYLLASGLSAVKLEEWAAAGETLALMGKIRDRFASSEDGYYVNLCLINENALRGYMLYAQGDMAGARQLFEEGLAIEESMNPPTGPPDVIKPIHELYGEVLLEMGEAEDARDAFAISLERMPGRSASLLGMARAAELINDRPLAYQYYREFLKNWEDADPNQAEIPEAEQYLVLNPDQKDRASAYLPAPVKEVALDQRLSINQCLPTGMQAMN
jgi:tetratricopeptide (TPR) repeat protein